MYQLLVMKFDHVVSGRFHEWCVLAMCLAISLGALQLFLGIHLDVYLVYTWSGSAKIVACPCLHCQIFLF